MVVLSLMQENQRVKVMQRVNQYIVVDAKKPLMNHSFKYEVEKYVSLHI